MFVNTLLIHIEHFDEYFNGREGKANKECHARDAIKLNCKPIRKAQKANKTNEEDTFNRT